MQEILTKAKFFNMMVMLVWVLHVLACGWYLCAALHVDHSETWPARRPQGLSGGSLLGESSTVQWLHSMYFVLTVFTTVGFGDIFAVTVGEIAYVVFVMLVGAIVHSIIIGGVINLVSEKSEDEKWRDRQKSLLTAFGRQTLMQHSSINKLTNHIDQMESGQQDYDGQEMRNMITGDALPRRLVGELPTQVFQGLLMDSKFVTNCAMSCYGGAIPPRFTVLLATMLRVQHYKALEIIMQMHDSASSIFIVQSGTFAAIGEPGPWGGSDATVFRTLSAAKKMAPARVGDDVQTPSKPGSADEIDSPTSPTRSSPTKSRTMARTLTEKSVDMQRSASSPRRPTVTSLKRFVLNHAKRNASDVSSLPEITGHRNYSSVLNTDCVSTLDQKVSAWIPFVSDAEQWLEIDLMRSRFVSGVKVAGHPSDDAWVTEFRVLTSTRRGFNNDIGHYTEEPQVFPGCVDKDTEVEVGFAPRMAQFIRIVPTRWHNRIGLRAGVVLSQNVLFPYQLYGRKNYFGDEVLFSSTRNCTTRCEADGEVLLLHKRDLLANGVGGRLYEDFPQFQRVLLAVALSRHTHRLGMLARLTRGCSYRHLAASLVQRFWRSAGARKSRAAAGWDAAVDELRLASLMGGAQGVSMAGQPTASGHPTDPKVAGLVASLGELRHDVASLGRKVEGMAASQGALAGRLEALAAQLRQLVAAERQVGITGACVSPGVRAAAGDTAEAPDEEPLRSV